MRRNSKYHSLKYVVECMPAGQAFYESIAAFNVDNVATNYAADCWYEQMIPGFKYRAMERVGRTYKLIAQYPSEAE